MKINSDMIRQLRNNRGWTQEQLSTVSGLSLRTIQRIEAQGNTSLESKVCLAATFEVNLCQLDVVDVVAGDQQILDVEYQPNKMVIGAGIFSLLLSVMGLLFLDTQNMITMFANMVTITAMIHTMFDWYFSGCTPPSSALRRAVQKLFIYLFIYTAFCIAGGQSNNILLMGLASGLIYAAIYYIMQRIHGNDLSENISNINN
ncbi:MAG: helix-turn-helix transcriptional regulator [Psychrobium sp.]|nr:helix-turn-helix transcriptional regulator [Psychrobium sp.]